MKAAVYYFSGTGNSLAIARSISTKLEHSKLISINSVICTPNDISGDIIGIVCPIYFHNMPHIVRDFLARVRHVKYLFMVYAGAGELGLCVRRTKRAFGSRSIKLSSLFNIPMPDNSTRYGEIQEEDQRRMLTNADRMIDDGDIPKMDRDFSTDDSCTGCAICQKVCPVNNITMTNGRPVWNKNRRCQACLACHNWCPQSSIKHTTTDAEISRYHHPDIRVGDIAGSSAEG